MGAFAGNFFRVVVSAVLMVSFLQFCTAAKVNVVEPRVPSARLPGGNDHSWNFLLLVQQWAGSVCSMHSCKVNPSLDYWTLHGLWPQRLEGGWPEFCNKSDPFNKGAIMGLIPNLTKYWADLYSGGSEQFTFWGHEWDKHGTCAQSDKTYDTQYKFFNEALNYRALYDIKPALDARSIEPSSHNTYTAAQIKGAIKSAYGEAPLLHCRSGKHSAGQILVELTMCLDTEGAIISCPHNMEGHGQDSCSSTDPILLPPLH